VTRIGILGGGQLGLMMAHAGADLDLEFTFLDPSPDACAGSAGDLITTGFDDQDGLEALARCSDIVTWDFENVPDASARYLARTTRVQPPPRALHVSQDRLREKRMFQELGLKVPPFMAVSSRVDLLQAVEAIGLPAVLKTRRLGYDGKGQAVLREKEDLERAWQALGDQDLILEAFVPFEAECSIIAVRSRDRTVLSWSLTRNLHIDGILTISLAPAFKPELAKRATEQVTRLLEKLEYIGVMAVEFFLTVDGELLINEMAPRVHNSGHWTIDGAETSQFENHLRAICGMQLGDTSSHSHSLMFNWLGSMPDAPDAPGLPGVNWHDYGKAARPGRKVGHATVTGSTRYQLLERAAALANSVGPQALSSLEALIRG
jgi:5-(carboxyamino)imidazole ribonucleotide synthase